jgi:isorenieratene synthase
MKVREWIKKKLKDYKIPLNVVDTSLPFSVSEKKRVAVVGGGIAGISAASLLAERGFEVHLFEKENFLGGKVGSWTFESNGETLRTEHGFHAFFRQYYNLLDFLEKIGSNKHLIPIDDYVLLYENNQKQGFKDLETTPGLNVWALRKHGVFGWLTMISPFSMPFLSLLTFNFDKTYKKYDGESFAHYAKKTFMPKKMQLVFNSFARAFFAEPEDMSMAELIKGFHFYFLSNDKGLVYDVLDQDFQFAFIDYCIAFLEKHQAQIHLNTPVTQLAKEGAGFQVNGNNFDYCVIASDVNGTKKIFENAVGFDAYPTLVNQCKELKNSGNYAVLRLWTDRFEKDKELPFFIFTDRLKCLDSITLYHKMEKESTEWSKEHNGGIFELHSYAVPKGMTKAECEKQLIEELYHYMPELQGMIIKHQYYQFRSDFPAFHTGLYKDRPTVETEVPNLFLAGDWVKMQNCTMLMEAAFTSGALAANAISKKENIQIHPLFHIHDKGIFA